MRCQSNNYWNTFYRPWNWSRFFFLTIGFFISEWQSFKNCSGCEPPRCVKVDRKMRCVNEGLIFHYLIKSESPELTEMHNNQFNAKNSQNIWKLMLKFLNNFHVITKCPVRGPFTLVRSRPLAEQNSVLSLLLSPQHENTAATLSRCLPTPLSLGSSVFDRPSRLFSRPAVGLSVVRIPPSLFVIVSSTLLLPDHRTQSTIIVMCCRVTSGLADRPRPPRSSITMLFSFRSTRWVAASSIRAIQPANHHRFVLIFSVRWSSAVLGNAWASGQGSRLAWKPIYWGINSLRIRQVCWGVDSLGNWFA